MQLINNLKTNYIMNKDRKNQLGSHAWSSKKQGCSHTMMLQEAKSGCILTIMKRPKKLGSN